MLNFQQNRSRVLCSICSERTQQIRTCTLGGESTAMGRNLTMVTIMMEGDWSTFPGINRMVLRKQIGPIITSRATCTFCSRFTLLLRSQVARISPSKTIIASAKGRLDSFPRTPNTLSGPKIPGHPYSLPFYLHARSIKRSPPFNQ